MAYYITTQFFAQLLSLNLQWIFDFLLNNVLWIFGFLLLGYYFYPDKKMLYTFLFITFAFWTTFDFVKAIGWVLLDPKYLFINNIAVIAVFVFCEADENLRKNSLFINTMRFFVVIVFFNLFMR